MKTTGGGSTGVGAIRVGVIRVGGGVTLVLGVGVTKGGVVKVAM